MTIEICEREADAYIFFDLAGQLWPDLWADTWHDNHDAEDLIRKRLVDEGCTQDNGSLTTPDGLIRFDSESGCFECHGSYAAVAYVRGIIETVLAEREDAREKLR